MSRSKKTRPSAKQKKSPTKKNPKRKYRSDQSNQTSNQPKTISQPNVGPVEVKKHLKPTIKQLAVGLSLLFAFSILTSYLFFFIRSRLVNYQPINLKVEFTNPHQAIVFFKTTKPALIYLKTGEKKHQLNQNYAPASARPSTTHVIEVGRAPINGLWLKFQVKGESFMVNWFMPTKFIQYLPSTGENL